MSERKIKMFFGTGLSVAGSEVVGLSDTTDSLGVGLGVGIESVSGSERMATITTIAVMPSRPTVAIQGQTPGAFGSWAVSVGIISVTVVSSLPAEPELGR
jgi:hypothetical protein